MWMGGTGRPGPLDQRVSGIFAGGTGGAFRIPLTIRATLSASQSVCLSG